MSNFPGFRAALLRDPEGVAAVLRTIREIPVTPGRRATSPPLWHELVTTIERESGWNPAAVNPYSKASGLIGFMPATAKGLGSSVEEIRTMGIGDQARLVGRFYARSAAYGGGLDRVGDLYVASAYPAALRRPAAWVIAEPGSPIWKQNSIWRDPLDEGNVTVRALLKMGTPPAMPLDLQEAVLRLVPDIEGEYLLVGEKKPATVEPENTPTAPSAPSAAPSQPDKGEVSVVSVPPVSAPRGGTAPATGRSAAAAAALLLLIYAGLKLRGCL
jgi:hypothetical protein